MDVQKFEIHGFRGYRFKDQAGKGCSIQQSSHGIIIGVNIAEGMTRMHLDKDSAFWLCQIILNYVETGEI